MQHRIPALGALACASALALFSAAGCSSGSGSTEAGSTDSGAGAGATTPAQPVRLMISRSGLTLPAPISGEAVASQPSGLLLIGGLDSGDVSTSSVLRIDSASGTSSPAGSLSQPLHDAAATALGGRVLLFGGGSATTVDDVQRLVPGRTAQVVGHLPQTRSDLSALTVGDSAVVLGGYDGAAPVSAVLETRDGRSFRTVADLPVPVRYASVTARGTKVYVLGGELADGTDSADVQVVDLSTGNATVAGHLPAGLSHSSAIDLMGRTYLLGGRLDGQTTDQVLRFEPSRVRAVRAGRLPEPVQNAAAGVLGEAGYLVGGLDPQGAPLSGIVAVRLSPRAPQSGSP